MYHKSELLWSDIIDDKYYQQLRKQWKINKLNPF